MNIIFDQLRISDDGSKMLINLHVNTAELFSDVYLDSITIMTADKAMETENVSDSSVCSPTNDFIFKYIFGDVVVEDTTKGYKEANIVLTRADLDNAFLNYTGLNENSMEKDVPYASVPFNTDFTKNLFFIYVKTKGAPNASENCCIPCRADEQISLGVTFDENLLYQRVMQYTRCLANDCQIPIGFMDFILLWNAFKASVETEHYISAFKYYNMLFGFDVEKKDGNFLPYGPYGGASKTTTNTCRCNG